MGTREGLRIIATLVGGGFLLCAAIAIVKGTLYDVDDGHQPLRHQVLPLPANRQGA